MDAPSCDRIASAVARATSRRRLLRGLAAGAMGSLFPGFGPVPTLAAPAGNTATTQDRGNAARTGVQPGPGLVGVPIPDARFAGGTLPDLTSPPVATRGTVFVGLSNGTGPFLAALDTQSGQARWHFKSRYPFWTAPAVMNGIVYAGSVPVAVVNGNTYTYGGATGGDDGTLYAIDALKGTERWRYGTKVQIETAPATSAGMVYIGTADGTIHAVDGNNGHMRWKLRVGEWMITTVAVAHGYVYAAAYDGSVFAVNAATGTLRWRATLGGKVAYTPAVAHGLVFVAVQESPGYLYALDAATGQERWHHWWFVGTSAAPAVAAAILYTARSEGTLNAYNVLTGDDLWTCETDGSALSSPSVSGDTVYVVSQAGTLYAVGATTGQELWTFATPIVNGNGPLSSPIVTGGTVYFANADGVLSAVTGS